MARNEIPSDNEVVDALNVLNGHASAVALCELLVRNGHDRADAQLAIQRATERRRLVINKDWTLSVALETVAA